MPNFIPFKGLLFNQAKVAMGDVVSPPYDVISPAEQDTLYARSAFNFVRLDFPKEEQKYAAANQRFQEWRKEQVLVQDNVPAYYILEQHFTANYTTYTRRGIIGLCRLEELAETASIRRHEKTYPKPKEDRLQLLTTTNMHFSQVLSIFNDADFLTDNHLSQICSGEPFAEFDFQNIHHRLWKITDTEFHKEVIEKFQKKEFVIADGHHRYETGLAYQAMMREGNPKHTGNEGYNYIMMYATNMSNEGLIILPTHRIVSHPIDNGAFIATLEKYFSVKHYFKMQKLVEGLRKHTHISFGVILKNAPTLMMLQFKEERVIRELLSHVTPDLQRLDVTILHKMILEQFLNIPEQLQEQRTVVDFTQDPYAAYKSVQQGKSDAAFILNPPRVDQVQNVAICGSTMPRKSTFFYPKLPSGTVLFDVNNF